MIVSTIQAGVDVRIQEIRGRISELAPQGAISTVTDALVGSPVRVEGFDPFGAMYTAALRDVRSTEKSGGYAQRASATVAAAGGATGVAASAETLPGTRVARLAYNAGFRGQDLVRVVAISRRESNWRPFAFNGNAATNDLSYGLMQINMKGNLGPARLREFGLTANEQLLDPQTNMNAAYQLYVRAGGSLRAWGGYKGLADTYNTDLQEAQRVVADAQLS